MKKRALLGLLTLSLFGCGDDDAGTDGGADTSVPDVGNADGNMGTDAGPEVDVGAEMDAGPEVDVGAMRDAGPGASRFLVGHLGGTSTLYQFDSPEATATSAGSVSVGTYNDIAAGAGLIALALPGNDSVAVLSADTLMPAMDDLSITPTPLTLAIDAARSRLYVYAAEGADNRRIHGFELEGSAFVPMEGSPYEVSVVATQLTVDETTGDLIGVSTTTVWIGRVEGGAFATRFGTPTSITAGSVVLDEERRRAYYTSRFPSQLHAHSLDDWSPVAGSPLDLPGEFPTSLDVSAAGDVFVLDGSSLGSGAPTTLVRASAEPFALAMACGSTEGCPLAETETGLAIDAGEERLYVTVVRGEEADGSVDVYDISNPEMPTEVTLPSNPVVGPVPAWLLME